MQPFFAYNALIWKNTITILTLILFVVFLVRGLYLFAVLGKHLLESNQGFQYQQQARDIRNSFQMYRIGGMLYKFRERLETAVKIKCRTKHKSLDTGLKEDINRMESSRP